MISTVFRSVSLPGFTAFLLGITLPVSTPLMNLSLGLAALCLFRRWDGAAVKRVAAHPLVWLPGLMVLLLAMSLLMPHSDYGTDMVGKYKKLLYVLPLVLFFRLNSRLVGHFFSGFLLANSGILALSLLGGLTGLFPGWIDPANPTVFRLHITQNFFMALAAIIWLFRASRYQGYIRFGYGLLFLLAGYNVLGMVLGRTGYVALVAGIGGWVLLSLPRRYRMMATAGAVLTLTLLVLIPNRAEERVRSGLDEIARCMMPQGGETFAECNTSMGLRTAFLLTALKKIQHAPWWGNGAGGFEYDNPETGERVHNPHNQYLLETVQGGVIGLSIFLVWMGMCFRQACRYPGEERHSLLTFLVCYAVCNTVNSFLLDSAEGHLFIILTAMLVAGSRITKEERNLIGR